MIELMKQYSKERKELSRLQQNWNSFDAAHTESIPYAETDTRSGKVPWYIT